MLLQHQELELISCWVVGFFWSRKSFCRTFILGKTPKNRHWSSPWPGFFTHFRETNHLQRFQGLKYTSWFCKTKFNLLNVLFLILALEWLSCLTRHESVLSDFSCWICVICCHLCRAIMQRYPILVWPSWGHQPETLTLQQELWALMVMLHQNI